MKTKVILLLMILTLSISCVKETYDMSRLDETIKISPGLVLSVAKGEINLKDIVKENDTLFFDDANLLKLVFRSDSVIEFGIDDLGSLDDTFDFSGEYEIGDLQISDFGDTIPVTLNQISTFFAPALRAQFVSLDDGSPHLFPAFPSTGLGSLPVPLFSGFEWAIFSTGTIGVSVKNNLPVPITGARVSIFNTSDNSAVGSEAVIGPVAAGATVVQSIDLAGVRATNSLKMTVIIEGSPGSSSPVIVDLDNTVEIGMAATGLNISSGRVIIPLQTRRIDDKDDTIVLAPGNGMELTMMKINTGSFSYTINSAAPAGGTMDVEMPTILRGGNPLTESVTVAPFSSVNGTISMDNTLINMSVDPDLPFNRIPVDYSLSISSGGVMVDFNSSDKINVDLFMDDVDFDYVKGYLGNQTESIDQDSVILEIEEVLDHISGQFRLVDPIIRVEYTNSFGFPVRINLDGVAKRGTSQIDLDLNPFLLDYPVSLTNREVSSSFVINKSNSKLPEFISLPPTSIYFSGDAAVNPSGNDGLRNNYLFGNSKFIASLEFELPMELWMKDLVFTDTLDNFLDFGEDFSADDIKDLKLEIESENMFPMQAGIEIVLLDSVTGLPIDNIVADQLISASAVDANGKSTVAAKTVTTIELDNEFFNAATKAGDIVIKFKMNTTDNGTKPVRIYSDYYLKFKVRVSVKPELIIN